MGILWRDEDKKEIYPFHYCCYYHYTVVGVDCGEMAQ